jgi:Protein of unknown function (DUF3995)
MTLLAGSVIAVLLALAALHLYWGFGGFWPGRDGPTLAERVAGWKSKRPASLASCAAVALALAASALIVAVQQDAAPRFGNWDGLWALGYWVVFGVFLLRSCRLHAGFRLREGYAVLRAEPALLRTTLHRHRRRNGDCTNRRNRLASVSHNKR